MRRRQVLASLGAAALAGCNAQNLCGPRDTEPLPNEDAGWPQQGPTPANQRRAPSLSVTDPMETWRIENDGPVTTPAVSGDTVYLSAGVRDDEGGRFPVGALFAFDRETGTQRWRTVFGDPHGAYAGCPPVVYRGTVYVGDAGHYSLYAVSARTGAIRWHAQLGGSVNRPVSAADGVVCLAQQDHVIAFDTMGEELWRYSKSGHVFLTTPTIVDGTVYVGSVFSPDGENNESEDDHASVVAALDLQTGDVVWEAARGENINPITAVDGTLYFSGANAIHALDMTDGSRVWEQPTGDRRFGRLAVDDERVYATGGSQAVAFGRDDGDVRWRYEADTYLRSHPMVTANSVVAATENPQSDDAAVAYALDVDSGDPRWTLELDGKMGFAPVAGENRMYLSSYRAEEQGVLVGVE
ncbi:PQQ-binding-like beta-propeller repeat protein [Haloferax larsenii]|uniref:PQQ-binding-like beta-propeller repeat protein n=1 Tax=Haloferax larsenii TaxID=302484 RepID=A0ABY5RE58_HALLR|nr:PQQ-binding-like beta-propeller repeat protein [Haloferax larsenii]UVE49892.1 PQQ-binding-like beta-propeller repeat protein [Haloferax larsenii]